MPVPIPNLQQLQINPPQPATMRLQAMGMQNELSRIGIAKDRNAIAREGMQLDQKQTEINQQLKESQMNAQALKTAFDSGGTPEQQAKIFEALTGTRSTFDFVGENVSVTYEDGTVLKGPVKFVREAAEELAKDPSWLVKDGGRPLAAWASSVGISFEKGVPKEAKVPTEAELTQRAAKGDKEAQFLLDAMNEQAKTKTEAQTQGKVQGLLEQMGGPEGVAKAIVEGREDWGKIKNTFGVPMIEMIRKEVLKQDAKFDFIVPTAVFKTLTSSLGNQEKQRGMMQSFVANINAQVNRVDEIMEDINRWGVRGLDLPKRELKKRLIGSGHEVTLEAYLTEISNEIGKLSTGSQASIRELSTEGQARWNKIHDPNLSLKEMKIILDETKNMAAMRMKTVDDTIELTKERMRNVMKPDRTSSVDINLPAGSNFEILSVED